MLAIAPHTSISAGSAFVKYWQERNRLFIFMIIHAFAHGTIDRCANLFCLFLSIFTSIFTVVKYINAQRCAQFGKIQKNFELFRVKRA